MKQFHGTPVMRITLKKRKFLSVEFGEIPNREVTYFRRVRMTKVFKVCIYKHKCICLYYIYKLKKTVMAFDHNNSILKIKYINA